MHVLACSILPALKGPKLEIFDSWLFYQQTLSEKVIEELANFFLLRLMCASLPLSKYANKVLGIAQDEN